jgi:hypothetical protein
MIEKEPKLHTFIGTLGVAEHFQLLRLELQIKSEVETIQSKRRDGE